MSIVDIEKHAHNTCLVQAIAFAIRRIDLDYLLQHYRAWWISFFAFTFLQLEDRHYYSYYHHQ